MGVQIVTLLDHYQLCPMVFMLPVVMGTMDFESWKHRTSHSLHPQGKRETTILIFNHTSVGLHTPRARRPFFATLTSASLHPLGEIDTYLWSSSTFLRVINLLKIQWSWNLLYIYCHDSFSFSFDCLAILSKIRLSSHIVQNCMIMIRDFVSCICIVFSFPSLHNNVKNQTATTIQFTRRIWFNQQGQTQTNGDEWYPYPHWFFMKQQFPLKLDIDLQHATKLNIILVHWYYHFVLMVLIL